MHCSASVSFLQGPFNRTRYQLFNFVDKREINNTQSKIEITGRKIVKKELERSTIKMKQGNKKKIEKDGSEREREKQRDVGKSKKE